jgi:energy-coupling factor transporter ATP-binding protein EcfA2
MLDIIEILGLRGFASVQQLRFARPTSVPGSGITAVVGANNAGKSTIVEALRAIVQREAPSITQGRRNQAAGDRIKIRVTTVSGEFSELESIHSGSSETRRSANASLTDCVLVLPSRRTFNPYFGRSSTSRDQYMGGMGFPSVRAASVDPFAYRLFRAHELKQEFNAVLAKVLSPIPEWTIDQTDIGQYFLKLSHGGVTHSSEGMGEGLISLLFIVDALYDSKPGDTIVIDEPELSLHPALQIRLIALFLEYSADRQIILATHSPYFIPLRLLDVGAVVARVHVRDESSIISTLKPSTAAGLAGLLKNQNNPHVLGLNAQEVFFLDDRVILTEGQEDVVFYDAVEKSLSIKLAGSFYGWGVGGAENMSTIASVLDDLGFLKVVGILDGNKSALLGKLRRQFPSFHFFAIPSGDVRTKPSVNAKDKVAGLLTDSNDAVRPEHVKKTRELFEAANLYMAS